MFRSLALLSLLFVRAIPIEAQNLESFKSTIDTLCSHTMAGRGYVNDGDKKAAKYIQQRFIDLGLKKFNSSYLQYFPIPVNAFTGKVELKINGKKLEVGKDYILSPDSPGGTKSCKAYHIKKKHIKDPEKFVKVKKRAERAIVYNDSEFRQLVSEYMGDSKSAARYAKVEYKTGIKLTSSKLTASMAQHQSKGTTFIVKESAVGKKVKTVEYTVEAEFLNDYMSQNVIGYIEGKTNPDSFIVIGGHYDHLGKMGDAYFVGANDNASGVAMVLELATYFSKPENQPDISIVFMAFGGEEVGLVGSKYFCENPYFDLKKTKFMLSLDLFGAGTKGITVVNSTEYTQEFELLQTINEKNSYLNAVKGRKPTANSDHYFFYKNGVPSFFLYTLGDLTAYHDIYDVPAVLEYEKFDDVFGLLRGFVSEISQNNQ